MWNIYRTQYCLAFTKKGNPGQVSVACIYNPSYLGGRDQEDHGLRPAQENSSQDHISKIPNRKKRAGGMAQVVECLPSKHEGRP
jgi:hypothetical protein